MISSGGISVTHTARTLSFLLLAAAGSSLTAQAADYRLTPGRWEITEGMSLSSNATPSQTRSICIQHNETRVTENWFVDLAKPSQSCNSVITSASANSVEFDLVCPSSNGDISGPVDVSVSSGSFSISSDLALQLGGHPLPMHRQLNARNVGQCY
ncbi:MAG: hypothetical protein CBB65_13200 [Hyphomonadaceae bacterium TMED5]|nr:hypothetical protein [Ponticaulis sp.]OUX97755.1 MAG: hypothetical protein CBB65_13200 [Hyphomonadaceae bacterium TMED5]|tara:strand:+ start:1158 stop:1622 length:465 start_codon:yes stop_codon:yes gene_type:complete